MSHSAFSDDRFNPVTLEEVPKLEVEVSLLHSFEKAKSALDWWESTESSLISKRRIRRLAPHSSPKWLRRRIGTS